MFPYPDPSCSPTPLVRLCQTHAHISNFKINLIYGTGRVCQFPLVYRARLSGPGEILKNAQTPRMRGSVLPKLGLAWDWLAPSRERAFENRAHRGCRAPGKVRARGGVSISSIYAEILPFPLFWALCCSSRARFDNVSRALPLLEHSLENVESSRIEEYCHFPYLNLLWGNEPPSPARRNEGIRH